MFGQVDAASLSEEEMYNIVGKAIVSVLNEPDLELKSEEKIVELSKVNGTWELSDPDGIMDYFYDAFDM